MYDGHDDLDRDDRDDRDQEDRDHEDPSRGKLAPPAELEPPRHPELWTEAASRRELERRGAGANEEPSETVAEYRRRMDEIDRLADEIAVLSAQIQAATYEVLVRLREFDQREGWGHHGAKSCAHWLAWRTSLDPGAAREWVRVARALEQLPALSEAMRMGEVSYSKARALTRIATPEIDASLVELARIGTASQIERIVRGFRRYGPKEERDQEQRLHDSRYVQVSRDEDGMFILRARLDPVAGAVVARALDAAGEALYQKVRVSAETPPEGGAEASIRPELPTAQHAACRDTAGHELAPGQRRADALVLLAESALAGGLDPGTAGERYQVVIHVDAPVLADPAEQGISALADGQHVSAETSRRVACDAARVVMAHGEDGSILDVGRKPARSRQPCVVPWSNATAAAASPAAASRGATPITSGTGPTAAKPASTTRFCCAGSITGWSTRRASR